MHKRLGIIILTTLILLLTCSTAALAAGDISLEQARDEIVSYYENNKPTLDNWEEVVGLSRAGVDFSVEPWQLPDWKVDEIGPTSPPSDYARTIIGMLAASHNPRDASGRDLVNELVYRQADSGEFGIGGGVFINTVWSMIALDTAGADYNAEKAVESLLANQTSDGGFSFNSTSSADADLTGFALMALAPYKELSEVNSAINEAQECLKNMQLGDSAGFASWGSANCNSTSAVIRGLVACGIDITTEEWQKSGRTMIDALFDFQLDNKSFCYTQGGSSNAMATQQALIAVADLVKAAVDYNLGQGGNSNPGQDEKTRIRVRVEGATQSLADETVTVAGTALDALKAAVGEENVTAPGGFITNIMGESGRNEVAENTDTSWCYYVIRDGAPEMTAFDEGAGSFNVKDGDEVVFYIGAYDNISYASRTYLPIVTVTPASPTAGQTITLNITAQKYVWGEGLQPLNAEEITAIGDYKVIVEEQEYISQSGQVAISDITQGTLDFIVTNFNEAGYPDVVSFKGSITVDSSGNEGNGGSTHKDEVTVEIAVVGKNNNLIFGPGSVAVSESDSYGITAMSALCKTGLSWGFSPDWDGLVTMIDGISNEGMNGWMYKVNHEAPMVVPRDKKVARGDQIIFWYSSDAMSNGPDWGDLGRGPSPGTGSGTGKADAQTLDSVKESLESYSKQLANMKAQNQILNAEKKMTAEKVQDLKKELDSNTFSLSQEVGQEETVLADAKTEVSLLVPADALSQATTLTIEKRSSSSAPASPNVRIVSSIYEFGPSGTKFDQMVTISLKVAITEDIDTANLTAAWYDEEKEKWANIPGIIDLKEGLVVFQIDHFSQFAVIELVPNKTEILPPELRKTFLDVDEKLAWARDAIEILAGQGIIRGTGKGFEPQRPITRAEFVKLVVTALDLEAEPYTNGRFSDVQSSDWFADAVGCACKHNIIVGYADGTFKPGHNITRNEIAAIFYRLEEASDDDPENSVLIKDIDTIPAWALDAVKYVTAQGLMQGYEDQTFRGNRPITRAEAAVVIFRYLEK